MSSKPWTKAEEARVREAFLTVGCKEAARMSGRSESAVRFKASMYGWSKSRSVHRESLSHVAIALAQTYGELTEGMLAQAAGRPLKTTYSTLAQLVHRGVLERVRVGVYRLSGGARVA